MKEVVCYLTFDGNCREAMTFYADALGARLDMMPFSDGPGMPPASADRIMHSRLTVDGRPCLMASDTMPGMPLHPGDNFSVSVGCTSLDEEIRFFHALSEGGDVIMPLEDTFWGAHFGMLKDRFGIKWLFNYDKPSQA